MLQIQHPQAFPADNMHHCNASGDYKLARMRDMSCTSAAHHPWDDQDSSFSLLTCLSLKQRILILNLVALRAAYSMPSAQAHAQTYKVTDLTLNSMPRLSKCLTAAVSPLAAARCSGRFPCSRHNGLSCCSACHLAMSVGALTCWRSFACAWMQACSSYESRET